MTAQAIQAAKTVPTLSAITPMVRLKSQLGTMFGYPPEILLSIVDRIYFISAALAAFFGGVVVIASLAQNKLNASINDSKDAAAHAFQVSSNERASELQKAAAEANAKAAEANLKAETERVERLKLEAQLAPRQITPEQFGSIAATMSSFRGQRFWTVTYTQNEECTFFNDQLGKALLAAGWIGDAPNHFVGLIGAVSGVRVTTSDSSQPIVKSAGLHLVSVLNMLGFKAIFANDPTYNDIIQITTGLKA